MFVARPQQNLTYATSCNSGGSRGQHHHVSRQAAKNQRRTQPKPRRPQALLRRRHLIRDLFAAGQVGHRCLTSAEKLGSAKLAGSAPCSPHLGAAPGPVHDGRCEGVRARLCARLLKRSCAELEVALERRHGDLWPQHVLRGDFHAMEGMRRICESFCLRPELERKVLKATADRAQAILTRRTEAQSCKPQQVAQYSIKDQNRIAVGKGGLDSRSGGSTHAGTGNLLASQSGAVDSDQGHGQQCTDTMSSVSDDASIAGTLDGTSSEGASAEEGLTIEEEMQRIRALQRTQGEGVAISGMTGSSSGGSSSDCEASSVLPWRVSWRSRALRVLGLQRFWPSTGVVWADAPTEEQEAHESIVAFSLPARSGKQGDRCDQDDDDDDDDDNKEGEVEEHLLSSKLVAAVRNAELQVAAVRSDQVLRWVGDSPSTTTPATTTPALSRSSSRGSKVSFSRSSEVSFFDAELEIAPDSLEYQRPLETKVFDGPSGHKAKRTLSSEKEASCSGDRGEVALSIQDDEDDEWEDHCDDIAELMSQERSGLLWSASW